MEFTARIVPHKLQFERPAGTSRGVYRTHDVWYVILQSCTDASHWGVGECAPLVNLSCDYNDKWTGWDISLDEGVPLNSLYEGTLKIFCRKLEETGQLDKEALRPYPSMLFGLETAMKHYQTRSFNHTNTLFGQGKSGISINGLIWMGDYQYMREQIKEKITLGYRCIKLKIGAIKFEEELALLKLIRKEYSAQDIELRVDANGAFLPSDAMHKLDQLSKLDLHSIEQPIGTGQWDEMALLTANTPLPIALDEELIGIDNIEKKKELLRQIKPQYIILKPTLHGGFVGAEEWINIANEQNIAWWITSALESNIGLNAIAQWSSQFDNPLPQGLGTGALYTNNIDMPLVIRQDCLWYDTNKATPTCHDFQ